MVMCPLWSGAYTPAFFLIPFVYMLKNNESVKNIYDFIYVVMFVSIGSLINKPLSEPLLSATAI